MEQRHLALIFVDLILPRSGLRTQLARQTYKCPKKDLRFRRGTLRTVCEYTYSRGDRCALRGSRFAVAKMTQKTTNTQAPFHVTKPRARPKTWKPPKGKPVITNRSRWMIKRAWKLSKQKPINKDAKSEEVKTTASPKPKKPNKKKRRKRSPQTKFRFQKNSSNWEKLRAALMQVRRYYELMRGLFPQRSLCILSQLLEKKRRSLGAYLIDVRFCVLYFLFDLLRFLGRSLRRVLNNQNHPVLMFRTADKQFVKWFGSHQSCAVMADCWSGNRSQESWQSYNQEQVHRGFQGVPSFSANLKSPSHRHSPPPLDI